VRRTIALGAILALLLAAFAGPNPTTAFDAPGLRPGDSWTYRTNTSLAAGFFLEGTATLAVMARETRIVEGVTLDVYRMSLNGLGTAAGTFTTDFGSTPATGSWILTGEDLFETRGLKVVTSVIDLEVNGTLHTEPAPLTFRLSVQNTTTLRLLENTWQFPFNVGDSGTMTARSNFSEDFRLFYGFPTTPIHSEGVGWRNVTYEAEGQVTVDTPPGRFETVRVRHTHEDGTYILSYFSPAAGNDAKSETYNESAQLGSAELVSYRYQALEAPRFLGLSSTDWATALAVVAATTAVALLWIRHRRRRGFTPPLEPPPTS